jgi:acyl carrier protein
MDVPDIHASLAEIIRDVLDDPDFEVTAETSAADHSDWDSFSHISIIVAVEMRFGIKFQTAEIESACNVGDFAALIARKCQAA